VFTIHNFVDAQDKHDEHNHLPVPTDDQLIAIAQGDEELQVTVSSELGDASSQSNEADTDDKPEVTFSVAVLLANCEQLAVGAQALGVGSLKLQWHLLWVKAKYGSFRVVA